MTISRSKMLNHNNRSYNPLSAQVSVLIMGFLLLAQEVHSFVVPQHCAGPRVPLSLVGQHQQQRGPTSNIFQLHATETTNNNDDSDTPAPTQQQQPPPMFNGKRVLPGAIVMTGLKASPARVAAVYAILSPTLYNKKGDGWDAATHVGVTQDFFATLTAWQQTKEKVAHVRALSFSFPQPNAMQDVANDWKGLAQEAGATLEDWVDPSVYLHDDDDDDDDDDDWDIDMTAQAMASVSSTVPSAPQVAVEGAVEETASETKEEEIISPFVSTAVATTPGGEAETETELVFDVETVDKVLDEVRPYLIADGGNVAVVDADPETMVASLELQGACGSCASSTVTMQMGIERVLKENFGPNVSVQQVDNGEDVPQSLSYEAVEAEVGRLAPAVIAMGGVVRIVSVEEETGVVKLNFRGANKVQQGLELALRDLPFVNAVQFVSEEEE
eukprot:CAMPEP_0168731822 /NCGR_PEP_ID=MMETSP0724-20121128/7458_1 /TAXON_ID=265536 /ORGANISM="Amphiprora sp., Strain CCMP467" /LENGTH=442 /DNA_ID=CAMNT_0008778831 /DNA_START=142 /DNA_END=1470 /DNA_ORIENTATION=+